MTNEDARQLILADGSPKAGELATLTGRDATTVSRWRSGKWPVPESVITFLEAWHMLSEANRKRLLDSAKTRATAGGERPAKAKPAKPAGPKVDHAPGYPFVKTDAGRAASARPGQRRDCTVRAVATAAGLTYDQAYQTLAQAGRKSSQTFNMREWEGAAAIGRVDTVTFPATKGARRMNPAEFVRQHPEGRWIVFTAKHVFAVVDGVVYDESPERADRCIYRAWKIAPATEAAA